MIREWKITLKKELNQKLFKNSLVQFANFVENNVFNLCASIITDYNTKLVWFIYGGKKFIREFMTQKFNGKFMAILENK